MILQKTPVSVELSLEDGDRDSIVESRFVHVSDDEILLDLMEPYLCNGWHDLTDKIACHGGMVFTDDAEFDDDGEIVSIGDVYAFTNYAVISEVETLLRHGIVHLKKHE